MRLISLPFFEACNNSPDIRSGTGYHGWLCVRSHSFFFPADASIINWSSAGEANSSNMPKSGMVFQVAELSCITMCSSFMLSFSNA
jgi:hypothetical protein